MLITPADALIIVDIQNDFLPGGSLAVPEGAHIIPVINQLADLHFQTIVTTQDWHPADHCSFQEHNGAWPRHCVQGTHGAELAPALHTQKVTAFFRKGTLSNTENYSGFSDINKSKATGLNGFLRERGVKRLFICGLAYDVCVADTACDAASLKFDTWVITDACASIQHETALQATSKMQALKIHLITSHDLLP